MFAEVMAEELAPSDAFGGGAGLAPGTAGGAAAGGLADAWDDAEGYYTARVGEVLDGRYEVFATHGRGVFSTVLRARCGGGEGEVALKVIRANETMAKAAQQEMVILKKLADTDPEGRRHCVRLLRAFTHRGHTVLVFESLAHSLRQVLRKYGRGVGLSLRAVQAYGAQLLVALKHLRNCGVLHADIKPDNVLVTARANVLKLADFGSAMFDGGNAITPYLASRFYRAPEVILGLPYSHPLDMWALGCVLFELATGSMAFPGRSNSEMLALHLAVKGPFPKKMVRRAAFAPRHFDAEGTFGLLEADPLTGREVRRLVREVGPTRDLLRELEGVGRDGSVGERRRVAHLADLLQAMWVLDPQHRITVAQALSHPFIKEPESGGLKGLEPGPAAMRAVTGGDE